MQAEREGTLIRDAESTLEYQSCISMLIDTYADLTTDLSRILICKAVSGDARSHTNALSGQTDEVRHPRHVPKGRVRQSVAQK